MTGLPFEAAVAQLVNMGFSRDVAEREVNRQIRGSVSRVGDTCVVAFPRRNGKSAMISEIVEDAIKRGVAVTVFKAIVWPLELTLPWSALCSDDERTAPAMRKGQVKPVQILTERYRNAKEKVRLIARPKVVGCAPAAIPLKLEARVWVPDNRIHDVPNFAKCVHDALQKLVYVNDSWLHDVRWIRAGVNVDNPRAEITITPIP